MTPRCSRPPQGAAAEAARRHRAPLPVLTTARLCLRAPDLADLPLWTEIYADWPTGSRSPEHAWEEFSYYTGGWLLHGHGLWTVKLAGTDTAIGFVHVGLEWDDWEPELGYMFAPEHRGMGYASEAAAAARDHALTILPTVVSYVDPENAPSNRLAARLGAARDGEMEARIAAAEGTAPNVWRHRRQP